MTEEAKAWLTRSGKYGERETWALEENVAPGGFGAVGDLSDCEDLNSVRGLVDSAYPDDKPQAQANFAAQLWTLRGRMSENDWVVLPLKSSPQLAIGRVAGPYQYRSDATDPQQRHIRPVQWVRTDIPRTAVKQDLLYSLGAFSTYCQVKRNEAARRIAAIAAGGQDPGKNATFPVSPSKTAQVAEELNSDDAQRNNWEQDAKDQITAVIQQEFAGHRMQELVAAVLMAHGYTCRVSSDGPDGGVDILAGSGPLGMDEPRLVVQVKSEQSPVGDPVVTQLLGSVSKHAPAQGLLVAWGDVTSQARKTAVANYFRLRVWSAEDLIHQITEQYPHLPEEVRAALPLKQIWIAVQDSE